MGGGSDGDRRVPLWLSVVARIWISKDDVRYHGLSKEFTGHLLHVLFHGTSAPAGTYTCHLRATEKDELGAHRFCHLTSNPGLQDPEIATIDGVR